MINDWILLSIFSVFSVIILCELWFCHNVIFRKTVKMTAITAFTNAVNLMNKLNIASWQRLKNRIQYDGSDSAEIPCYKPTWSDGTSKSIEEMTFMIERENPPKKLTAQRTRDSKSSAASPLWKVMHAQAGYGDKGQGAKSAGRLKYQETKSING